MKIKNLIFKLTKYESLIIVGYLLIVTFELLLVRNFSDLPTELPNWAAKSRDLLNLDIPKDNFYGPGGAILLIPFLWNGPTYIFATITYCAIGFFFYYKICEQIRNPKFKFTALFLPLLNVYLFWLFISSQDTVLEFALYLAFVYFAIKNRWLISIIIGVLLAETRSGYWAIMILGIISLYLIHKKDKKFFDKKAFLVFPSLIIISVSNYVNYDSASPALEGGLTSYFSYAKHHYLSLPKFDMDVFLSGPNGDFSDPNLARDIAGAKSGAEVDRIYYKYALKSIAENPKETILGWMQKFESHFISIQKVPNLPGRYVYDSRKNSIRIENERLSWHLVLGNLIYEIYRFLLLISGLVALGIYQVMRRNSRSRINFNNLNYLFIFWVFSLIPALLYYSETRFKIVQEVSLIPLILFVYSEFLRKFPKEI